MLAMTAKSRGKAVMRVRSITVAGCLLLLAASASAAEYRIRDRDGAALAGAIRHANATPGADVIVLRRGGIYPILDAAADGLALPTVTDALRIEGNDAEIRRYTDARLMLLQVAPGARLELSDLTLAEGSRGAVHNRGTLVLERVRITDSSSSEPAAIVLNEGELQATASEFGYNQLLGASADGGTLVNRGLMRLTDSRIVSNSASRRDPITAAAAVLNLGTLELDRVTVVDNRLTDGFGGDELTAVLNLLDGQSSGSLVPR